MRIFLFAILISCIFGQSPPRIAAASFITKVEPEYPPSAKNNGIRGIVSFDATIDKSGRVSSLKLISGQVMLVEPAREAVMQWVYKPTLMNGVPIDVIMRIDVPFGVRPSVKRVKAG